MRKFTKQQVDYICDQIGIDDNHRTNKMGFSKKMLKKIICGEEYENLEDEYDVNCKAKPWETEPDFLEFVDESTGYRCFIWRHPELKHLWGFVELPKEHKLYGETNVDKEFFLNLDVHGGITYAKNKIFKDIHRGVPLFISVNYVVGFDCAHAGDYSPCSFPSFGTYKDIEYVTNECKKLAKQLKELE
jgi:phage-related protein